MGKEKKRYSSEQSPIRLDDLDPRHDVNGGNPVKYIFGILHRPQAIPARKRSNHAKTKR